MAIDYQTLADELTNDPLGRGYAGMTDAAAAADLNTEYRTRIRATMTGDEVFQQTDPAEFAALDDGSANNTPDSQGHWLAFCGKDSIDPQATANVQFLRHIYGASSTTESNLAAARQETISRATELGFGEVKVGHIEQARAQFGA